METLNARPLPLRDGYVNQKGKTDYEEERGEGEY
jgi:hypothetical protein